MSVPAPKMDVMIVPQTVTNAGTATGYVDCLGYDYCVISVVMTTADTPTNNPTVFRIGDETSTTTTTNSITELVGDGTDGWTIPTMSTATTTNNSFLFGIDCRSHERYLHLYISPLLEHTVCAIANLFRADELPTNSTEAGTIALVTV